MAFLTQYRKLRDSSDEADRWRRTREVEYNFARTFHQLGLYPHAVKHYECVLELAEKAGVSVDIPMDLDTNPWLVGQLICVRGSV
jgi:hypothetical protein